MDSKTSTMPANQSLNKALLLGIAILQSIVFFCLYKAIDVEVWPSESPLWHYPLWTFAVCFPLFLLYTHESGNLQNSLKLSLICSLVIILLAIYIGRQATPFDQFPVYAMNWVFSFTILIACFKCLMYMQWRLSGQPLSYPILFINSWRNFLIFGLSILFVGIFWLILVLWAALFDVINISFFKELFKQDWFIFPVLGFAHGLGVIIFRELTSVLDSITRLLQGLLKLLLPLVLLLAVVFLAALPFAGLDILWGTGKGTYLLMFLTAIILFFTNAVYQDGVTEPPYSTTINRLVYSALICLPVLSSLSFYGLILRINQYGWTIERCWGIVVWLILALFSIGYCWGVLKHKQDWTKLFAKVNIGMSLIVLSIIILSNSPLMDFRKISLSSQMNRVESGEVELKDFDYFYAHEYLTRPGYFAVEKIKSELTEADSDLLKIIENPINQRYRNTQMTEDKFWSELIYRTESIELTPSLKSAIQDHRYAYDSIQSILIEVDLNEDGSNEYALINFKEDSIRNGSYFYQIEDGWENGTLSIKCCDDKSMSVETFLKEGTISIAEPQFKHLKIGDELFETR